MIFRKVICFIILTVFMIIYTVVCIPMFIVHIYCGLCDKMFECSKFLIEKTQEVIRR